MAEPHPRAGRRACPTAARALLMAARSSRSCSAGCSCARPASRRARPPRPRRRARRAAARPRTAGQTSAAKTADRHAEAAPSHVGPPRTPGWRSGRADPAATAASAMCRGSATSATWLGLCNGRPASSATLNNICTPATPEPEQATSGIDSLITTPGSQTAGQDAVRQLRHGRAVLGGQRAALLGHDLADRQQRRGHGLRHGQIAGPGHDHRVPVGGGQQHPVLAAAARSTS